MLCISEALQFRNTVAGGESRILVYLIFFVGVVNETDSMYHDPYFRNCEKWPTQKVTRDYCM